MITIVGTPDLLAYILVLVFTLAPGFSVLLPKIKQRNTGLIQNFKQRRLGAITLQAAIQ
jgi:hypothetical protein